MKKTLMLLLIANLSILPMAKPNTLSGVGDIAKGVSSVVKGVSVGTYKITTGTYGLTKTTLHKATELVKHSWKATRYAMRSIESAAISISEGFKAGKYSFHVVIDFLKIIAICYGLDYAAILATRLGLQPSIWKYEIGTFVQQINEFVISKGLPFAMQTLPNKTKNFWCIIKKTPSALKAMKLIYQN